MSKEPDWEAEIQYPNANDTLLVAPGGEGAKTLFTDLIAGHWSIYADGYRKAADVLVDKVEGEPPDDVLLLPIVFLYRHFVELTLKDLLLRLVSLCHIGIDPKQITTHKLLPLWEFVKQHLHCVREEIPNKDIIPALDKLLGELSDIDPDSMHFRYAVDKELVNVALPRSLSMSNLKETMEKFYNAFTYLEAGIDMEWDARDLDAEFQAEMESFYY